MEYKEAKKLLFDENVKLSYNQAKDIINLMNKPRIFSLLLNADKEKIHLNVYDGVTDINNANHTFKKTDKFCFSSKVVKKFFELKDEEISVDFIRSLSFHLFCNEDGTLVYEWPYFSGELMHLYGFEMIEALVLDMFFVFNFEQDVRGRCFSKIIEIVYNDDTLLNIVAVNSFNLGDFIDKIVDDVNIDASDMARFFAYSIHYIGYLGCMYGSFRKLFIQYIRFGMNVEEYVLNKARVANNEYVS